MDFDAADNVVNDNVNSYSCDAEGRICAFSTPSGTGGNIVVGYLYDANGARVAKGTIHSVLVNGVPNLSCDPATNGFQLTERYVLGQGGEELTMLDGSGNWQRTNVYGGSKQLATYDIASNPAHTSTNGLPATAPALHFQLTDPLGTRRMQTNADGQPETDIQSLPFGDGLSSAPDQYAPVTADDATPLHFTGKERDTESGNDYFGARYYASTMARFLSPDWAAKAEPVPYAKLDNPQSLNLYVYVLNNPMTRFDLDGHMDCAGKDKGSLGCNYNAAWNARHGIDNGAEAQQQNFAASGGAPTATTPGAALNAAQLQAVKTAANKLAAICANAFFSVIPVFSLTTFDSEMQNATYNQYPVPYTGPPNRDAGAEADTQPAKSISGRFTNLYPDFFVDTPQRQAAVIVHENIHRNTGWSDPQVFRRFAGRGLTHNDHYQTDEITRWILRGCQ